MPQSCTSCSFEAMSSPLILPTTIDCLSLFLDFDGTLVPIAPQPHAIEVRTGLVDLLHRVSQRLEGRLVLVSGRAIADLDRHLGLHKIALAGSHGHELRLPNRETTGFPHEVDLTEIRGAIHERASELAGLELEMKPYGVALHYRQTPHLAKKVNILADQVAQAFGMTVTHGKMVAEILPRGSDKGEAVRAIMARGEFIGTIPMFVGDDITDEDGFRVAQKLGGIGVLVGERDNSVAKARLSSHKDVWHLLEQIDRGAR